jgi:hypothetical protein
VKPKKGTDLAAIRDGYVSVISLSYEHDLDRRLDHSEWARKLIGHTESCLQR